MKLLFLAYETDSWPAGRVAKRFQEDGHDVRIVNFDLYYFLSSSALVDWYDEQGLDYSTLEEEYDAFHREEPEPDWRWLRRFEERYCTDKTLHHLLMSQPSLARWHHERDPYYTPIEDPKAVYAWAEMIARKALSILDDFQPDAILSVTRRYLGKNLTAEVAKATDRPMYTLVRSRVGDRWHVGDGLATALDPSLLDRADGEGLSTTSLEIAENIVRGFAEGRREGLYESRSQRKVQKGEIVDLPETFNDYLQKLTHHIKRELIPGRYTIHRGGIVGKNHFHSHSPSVIKLWTTRVLRKLRYAAGSMFELEPPNRDYLYAPLHTAPESSTLTLTRVYHEADILRFVAERMPVDLTLAAKENPNMIGVRPLSFYEEIRELPNVELIDPSVPTRELQRGAQGVVGISGTALLEAATLGKPTHAFGLPEFREVLTTHGYDGFGEFTETIRRSGEGQSLKKPTRYIAAAIEFGSRFDREALFAAHKDSMGNTVGQELHRLFARRLEEAG